MDVLLDTLTAVLLVAGGVLSLVAGIGLLRFDDLLSRMHAGTKPQVLGLICVMLAVGIRNPGFAAAGTIVLVVGFQLLTVPVSAHMVGRAAYRAESVSLGRLTTDELAEAVTRADEAAREAEARAQGATETEAGEVAEGDGPGRDRAGERPED